MSQEKPPKPHKNGFRGPSPDVGKATQFKPGNPGGGRPKSKPITDAILAALEANDGELLKQVAVIGIKKAAKGDIAFWKEIIERIEGKSVQPISGPDGGAIPHTLEGIDEYIMELVRSVQDQTSTPADDGRGKDSARSSSRSKTKGDTS